MIISKKMRNIQINYLKDEIKMIDDWFLWAGKQPITLPNHILSHAYFKRSQRDKMVLQLKSLKVA